MNPVQSASLVASFLFLVASPSAPPTGTQPAGALRGATSQPAASADALAQAKRVEADLSASFGSYTGCAVVYDPGAKTVTRYNAARCAERFSPCSTFKIPNSLIGLETGVIPDADFEIKWDGVKRPLPKHNQDHTLRTATRDSVVWYYQELARRVGRDRMQDFITRLGYGNQDISGPVDEFWLGGPLTISADEQVAFVDRLRRFDLPFSRRSMDIVHEIMVLEQKDGWTLRGKTGTQGRGDKNVFGWFVGWVEFRDRALVFAVNISADERAMGADAKRIALAIVHDLGAPFEAPARP